METQTHWINGTLLHAMFEGGYRNLKRNMDTINDLNVFPVPDGDTGTNMVKTLSGGVRGGNADEPCVDTYMQQMSQAVLLSARGNSGVIFSQFIHGLGVGARGKEAFSLADFAYAFSCAKNSAYRSVITPTEGTMLTLIRCGADFLKTHLNEFDTFETCLDALIDNMKQVLTQTPDMLPVLKEAGVVDSGGAGLICVMEGMRAGLCGVEIEDIAMFADSEAESTLAFSFGPDSVLEYGYCTEFILQLMHAKTDVAAFDIQAFIKPLEEMGDSIVAFCNDTIVKVHIHTFSPETVLGYARTFGEFVTMKIENMSVQHSEQAGKADSPAPKEHLKFAIIAAATGSGMIEYFKSIGATVVINGGQTQNPSVDDFLRAFDSVDAEHIIVLPNNSNVVMTAKQAAQMYTATDVRVIPTKSVVEGYSALSMMNLWVDTVDELLDDMTSCLDNITTGLVTTATRDSHIGGANVKAGDYIALDGETILASGDDKVTVALELVRRVNAVSPKEVFTVFVGEDASAEEAAALSAALSAEFPLAEVGMIDGKQPVYTFILSLE